MTRLPPALSPLMDQQAALLDEMREVLEDKKTALVRNDMERLLKVDQQLDGLARHVKTLEAQQQKVLGHRPLRDWLGEISPLEAEPVVQRRQRLHRVAAQVRQLNGEVRQLLDLALRWVHQTVTAIAEPNAAGYSAQGTAQNGAPMRPRTVERQA